MLAPNTTFRLIYYIISDFPKNCRIISYQCLHEIIGMFVQPDATEYK